MSAWSEWTSLVYQRSGGLCEVQVSSRCNGRGEHYHHRKLRSRGGGNTVGNLAHVCNECHTWVHLHPAKATDAGWMVASWSDPVEIPVRRYGHWVRLDDQGGMTPAEVSDVA